MANQFNAAITAEVNRGKASGLYIDKTKLGGGQDDSLIMRIQGSALQVVSDTEPTDDDLDNVDLY